MTRKEEINKVAQYRANGTIDDKLAEIYFIAGAEWKRKKDEELFKDDSWNYIEENYPNISREEKLRLYDISIKSRLAGAYAVKQKMMKDAVEAEGLPKNKGWVAKDYDGTIRLFFLCPPQRIDDKRYKYWYGGPNASKQLSNDSFPDLKWEDEPIEVELTIKKI